MTSAIMSKVGRSDLLQISDQNNLAALRSRLLEMDPGAYGDLFVDLNDKSTFIGRWQHQKFGANDAQAVLISPCFLSRLPDATSVIDLTDSDELELASGSFDSLVGGLSWSASFEAWPHFMGIDYNYDRYLAYDTTMERASGASTDLDFLAAGFTAGAPGALRGVGAVVYDDGANRNWQSGYISGSVGVRSTGATYTMWVEALSTEVDFHVGGSVGHSPAHSTYYRVDNSKGPVDHGAAFGVLGSAGDLSTFNIHTIQAVVTSGVSGKITTLYPAPRRQDVGAE